MQPGCLLGSPRLPRPAAADYMRPLPLPSHCPLPALPAGKAFPSSYTQDLKAAMAAAGKIGETGCPEYFFY